MQTIRSAKSGGPLTKPVIPVRGIGPFPWKKWAFKVGRQPSLKALEKALEGDGALFLVAQHDEAAEEPGPGDVYRVGTLTNILRYQRTKVAARGAADLKRAAIDALSATSKVSRATKMARSDCNHRHLAYAVGYFSP